MDLTGETLYQVVRVLFAVSLLGFLLLVIRVTLKDLNCPMSSSGAVRPVVPRAELLTLAGESGSTVADGRVYELQGVATLGRAASARVVLEDSSVSAQHALLRPVDGIWTIEDLGSRNGTLVNGRKITGAVDLSCGDSIQLGRVHLRLMC
jgi:pSer/pThr/pTyr-binding forkhead associated (FHA) protein